MEQTITGWKTREIGVRQGSNHRKDTWLRFATRHGVDSRRVSAAN